MKRTRVRALLVLALLVPLTTVPGWAHAAGATEHVSIIDNLFDPDVIRIPVGGTVEWTNDGKSPHDVTANDGSFASGTLDPSASYTQVFAAAGAYPYYCSFHGSPGVGMTGWVLVGDTSLPGAAPGVGPGRETPPAAPAPTLRVPQDFATIQGAVDDAKPGGLVLISPGVYHEAVIVTTPFITIRGTDRNAVILDGGFTLANAIHVIEADGVSIENMTARHYLLNGFLWSGVFGFRGSYLTAYDDGDYGLFAYDSQYGQFDDSYASGHPDSGFYIGQCNPCHAVISDVLAENNAIGFSGTNAGGDLRIINSEWRDNFAGIVPNTLDSEANPPQRGALIAGNWVHDNNNPNAPAKPLQYPSFGMGIVVAGGLDNVIEENLVEAHEAFGIVVILNIDANVWLPSGNRVIDNVVRDSGRADLALGGPSGGGNCFSGNDFGTSAPPAIELFHGCGFALDPAGGGEPGVTLGPLVRFIQANAGDAPSADWRSAPPPPPQPQMPAAAGAPPDPAIARTAVPQTFTIRDARTLAGDASTDVNQEVTLLGFPLATTWWGTLIGLYGYVLPLVLYSAWVSIALWDLVRQEAVPNRKRAGWMAVVLLVPLLGPVAYYAFGRSPIQRSLRWMLVAGGLAIYAMLAVLGILIGSS